MLHDTIRTYRKAAGLTQEELAGTLHVVRQTVSKWEKGLSVPDADQLPALASALGVTVHQLLGLREEEELTTLRARLEEMEREKSHRLQAGRQRGKILVLSFLALFAALLVDHEIISLLVAALCMLGALGVLYRNLDLLTREMAADPKLGVLRMTTLVNGGLLVLTVLFAILTAADILTVSEQGEQLFAMLLIAGVMLFTGLVAPRLPYSRHTGLRLPWTVLDEETWNVAHQVLGLLSLPLALLYVAAAWALPDFEMVTLCAVVLWVGITGGLSYLFFRRKVAGKGRTKP